MALTSWQAISRGGGHRRQSIFNRNGFKGHVPGLAISIPMLVDDCVAALTDQTGLGTRSDQDGAPD